MSLGRKRPGFGRDQRGVVAVEFAMILMPMLILIFGMIDIGYQIYATSILQGTVANVARSATLEGATLTALETEARMRLDGIATGSDVVVASTSYKDFSSIGKPEKITTDTAPIGSFNPGDCYIDANSNGSYDTAQGTAGLGGAEDVINFSVTVTFHRLTPIAEYLGMDDPVSTTRSAVLRNEPYSGVVDPPTVCVTP